MRVILLILAFFFGHANAESVSSVTLTKNDYLNMGQKGSYLRECPSCEYTWYSHTPNVSFSEYGNAINDQQALNLLLIRHHQRYTVGLGDKSNKVYFIHFGSTEIISDNEPKPFYSK